MMLAMSRNTGKTTVDRKASKVPLAVVANSDAGFGSGGLITLPSSQVKAYLGRPALVLCMQRLRPIVWLFAV